MKTIAERTTWEQSAVNVLCVDDTKHPDFATHFITPNGLIQQGKVYRVTGSVRTKAGTGLVLLGYPAIRKASGIDCGWHIDRFKPCGGMGE